MTSASPNRRRYLTSDGTNQLKSNFASSPTSAARLVTRINSPVQRAANASSGSIVGRLPAEPAS